MKSINLFCLNKYKILNIIIKIHNIGITYSNFQGQKSYHYYLYNYNNYNAISIFLIADSSNISSGLTSVVLSIFSCY
jgi:hypothetical protein